MMKKTVTFIMLCLFVLTAAAQNAGIAKHEVTTGETLSSIARTYGTSVKELTRLNPSLNPDYVMAGQKINVPAKSGGTADVQPAQQQSNGYSFTLPQTVRPKYKTTHEVKKKETIYSVSRMYGITENQLIAANPELKNGKLKKGAVINIPYTDAENQAIEAAARAAQEEAEQRRRQEEARRRMINVAVILPFGLSSETMTAESQKMANLYQGFLLAVDTLKRQGYDINVFAYDESTQAISTIIDQPALKEMSLIVGPMRQQSVRHVAEFAASNGINHVVPIANDINVVNSHPTTFQINVAGSVIFPEVSRRFVAMHEADNIIFLSMGDNADNAGFVAEAKQACSNAGKAYHSATSATLSEKLLSNKLNVIVPSSGTAASFNTLCSQLNSASFAEGTQIQLFGYPEWQTFMAKQHHNFARYSCQFFTPFYHNPSSWRTQAFESRFSAWFHQQQYNSLPRYGELGYDIGMYFLKAIKGNGKNIAEHAGRHTLQDRLEFPIRFERKNTSGGWLNTGCLIVQYNADGSTTVK